MDVLSVVPAELLRILCRAGPAAPAHGGSLHAAGARGDQPPLTANVTAGEVGRKTSRVHSVGTATCFVHDRLIPGD